MYLDPTDIAVSVACLLFAGFIAGGLLISVLRDRSDLAIYTALSDRADEYSRQRPVPPAPECDVYVDDSPYIVGEDTGEDPGQDAGQPEYVDSDDAEDNWWKTGQRPPWEREGT